MRLAEAEIRHLQYEVDCDAAARLHVHEGACFAGGRHRFIGIRVPETERPVIVTAEGVWEHLSDALHAWPPADNPGMKYLERLEAMGVCLSGFLTVDVAPALQAAAAIMRRLARIEASAASPLDDTEPEALHRAFDVIRMKRADRMARKQHEIEARLSSQPT